MFHSILYASSDDGLTSETADPPAFFIDLNLDQVIHTVVLGKQEYDLKPFFYTPLRTVDAILYRHEIMRDLENQGLFEPVQAFSRKMHTMREQLAEAAKLYYKRQRERCFLDAVKMYCEAVQAMAQDLSRVDLKSRGFLAFREYLNAYADSEHFASLLAETDNRLADLASVDYCLLIRGNSITVRKYASEPDYSAEVESTFDKFRQAAVKDYAVKIPNWLEMNHVEGQVLELVALLYPEVFSNLAAYCASNASYLDTSLAIFDRQVQFYIAYLEHVERFKQAGLGFCYPEITRDKQVSSSEGFDLALAYKLMNQKSPVVCNDFYLKGEERIFVVSGPNQGGKTTFARTFGQLHFLAALGLPVPGRQARLFLFDKLLTHFEKQEDIRNLRGKLEDDLVRVHNITSQATSDSIIIMNEIFASTTLSDAVFLSRQVLQRIMDLDALCVWVTFIDELASLSAKTVSVVSTVVPENPAVRTFKLVRKPADGLAYALSIANKYRLTYKDLQERLHP